MIKIFFILLLATIPLLSVCGQSVADNNIETFKSLFNEGYINKDTVTENKKEIDKELFYMIAPTYSRHNYPKGESFFALGAIKGLNGLDLYFVERIAPEIYNHRENKYEDFRSTILSIVFLKGKPIGGNNPGPAEMPDEDMIDSDYGIHYWQYDYIKNGIGRKLSFTINPDTTFTLMGEVKEIKTLGNRGKSYKMPLNSKREVRCYISPGGWLRISEYKHFEISSPLFDIDFINKEKETNPEFGNYPTKDNPYAPFEFPLFRMDISPVRFSGMGMTLYYKESDSHIYPVLEVYDETRRTPANPEGRKFLYRYIIGKTKGAETEGVKHFEKCSPLIKTSDGYIELLPDGMLVPYKKN